MTTATGPTAEQVRQLLEDARAVVAAVAGLREHAGTPEDVAWIDHRAEYVAARQADVEAAARAADAVWFPSHVQAVANEFRPLEDAPPALQPALEPVLARFEQLARDMTSTFDPYVEDGGYAPGFREALTVALQRAAAG